MTQPLETAIQGRAAACGLELDQRTAGALASHMRAVLEHNPVLHLTSITEPDDFVARHLGEGFEGTQLFEAPADGEEKLMVDLGTGNGYPALPFAAATGLRPVLVEASARKAYFLRELRTIDGLPRYEILERQVQRAADLEPLAPEGSVRVLTIRAVGGWPRLLPKLARCLEPEHGRILLWAGEEVEQVAGRSAWKKTLRLVGKHSIPDRDRSWIWAFARADS